MAIFIIPARGGSKRIPQKNIKLFKGVPIIERVIKTVKQSDLCKHLFVSTEDEQIADIASKAGADIIPRPDYLASDHAKTREVMEHAVGYINATDFSPVCCIYPTSVFVTTEDIRSALYLLDMQKNHFVISATEYSHPPQRALHLIDKNLVMPQHPELMEHRTQDLAPTYHDAGQFYWAQAASWLTNKPIISRHTKAYILPRSRAVDIDTPDDWIIAERLLEE